MSEIRVDIGCGKVKHKDCNIGLDSHDFSAHYGPGEFTQHNILEPLPFDDCSVDWIYCHHVLEHLPHRHGFRGIMLPERDIDALIFVINEFQRVLKYDCEAFIVVPWKEHTNAWRHPSHYRFFDENYFGWFSHKNPTPDHEAEGLVGKWEIRRNEIVDAMHVVAVLRKME